MDKKIIGTIFRATIAALLAVGAYKEAGICTATAIFLAAVGYEIITMTFYRMNKNG